MDLSILEELGLSKGECKTYLTLLELGTTKVGSIIERSRMASSAIHNSLNSLISKGLVSYIKKGKIKFYQAAPPKQIIDFLDDKKKKVLLIIPELESKQSPEEKQEAEVFEGKKGITTMLNSIIEDAKPKDEYLFFAIDVKEQNEEIQKFFKKYDLKRKEKKLIVKGLAPKKIKHLFVKRKIVKMKYPSYPIPSNISICKDKIAFFSWGEKPVGYLIKSKQISRMYKRFFKEVWNKY